MYVKVFYNSCYLMQQKSEIILFRFELFYICNINIKNTINTLFNFFFR